MVGDVAPAVPYVTEQGTRLAFLELAPDEAERLEAAGFITPTEDEETNDYDTTALVWDELGLEGDRAIRFLRAALGKE